MHDIYPPLQIPILSFLILHTLWTGQQCKQVSLVASTYFFSSSDIPYVLKICFCSTLLQIKHGHVPEKHVIFKTANVLKSLF